MKKRILTLFLLPFIAFAFCVFCFAEESLTLPEEFGAVVDGLPPEVSEYLPSEIYSDDAEKNFDGVKKMMSVEYITGIIGELIGLNIGSAISLFATLMGIIILSSLFRAFSESSLGTTLKGALGFCTSVALFSAVIVPVITNIEEVKVFFERIGALMMGMIPATGVIYAMGGNVSTAATSGGTMYLFLAFCETFCAGTVIPVATILSTFCLCGVLLPTLRIASFSSAIKKCYTVALGFVMSVFLCVLSSQTLLSSSADGVSARAAKLVATNVIPIVGGSVGETLRTVAASVGYIKNVSGIGGIMFIFILLLPVLISLLLFRLVLIFASSFADALGCEREKALLTELGGVYGTLIAVVSMVSVMFILSLGIFVRCSVAAA